MSCNNYTTIGQFGGRQYENDPATICAFDNVDKSFESNYEMGPGNKNCQIYMAQRSARNWDIYAEHLSNNVQNKPSLVNLTCGTHTNGIKTLGDAFLINTGYEKFCTFPGASYQKVYLNPTDASSPVILQRLTGNPVCNMIDPQTIDDDVVMRKIIHRQIGDDLLINIWNTCKQNGVDIENTRTGKYIKEYVLPFSNSYRQ